MYFLAFRGLNLRLKPAGPSLSRSKPCLSAISISRQERSLSVLTIRPQNTRLNVRIKPRQRFAESPIIPSLPLRTRSEIENETNYPYNMTNLLTNL
jgi:hypothetical protein